MNDWKLGAAMASALMLAGCASILGIEEQTYDGEVASGGAGGDTSTSSTASTTSGSNSSGAGGASTSSGAGGASTSSGAGGAGGASTSTTSTTTGSSSTSTTTSSSSSGGGCGACDPATQGGSCVDGRCLSEWAQWEVPNFATGLPHPASYDKRVDVVVDEVTYLMWQRNVLDTDTKYPWSEAKDHCLSLSLDGHDDWRLPNAVELQSIVKPMYTTSPTIDAAAFPNTPTSFFATSSPAANDDTKAWRVNFGDGSMTQYSRLVPAFVRCVRGPIY